jgi:transcriptional regulator with XRE-family HTH domain
MRKWHKAVLPLVPKTLGDHFKCKRLERKLSQEQVAAILGVSDPVISFWEANFYPPPYERRERVIAFLGYDPEAPESASQQQSVTG